MQCISKAVSSTFKPLLLSLVCWPYLHCSGLQGVTKPSKGVPVDSICIRRVASPQIAAIKVGGVTFVVPPSSLIMVRAV